ncbi:hypothetical protein ACHAXR_005773, partial [Thalassiosira sp. AJA248-18]
GASGASGCTTRGKSSARKCTSWACPWAWARSTVSSTPNSAKMKRWWPSPPCAGTSRARQFCPITGPDSSGVDGIREALGVGGEEHQQSGPVSANEAQCRELQAGTYPGCQVSGHLMENRVAGNFHIEEAKNKKSVDHKLSAAMTNLPFRKSITKLAPSHMET